METILLSLYIVLYVPLMETAATRSTTVVLNLVEEGHVLEPPVECHSTQEFLIPTQLYELFYWVHQLKPLVQLSLGDANNLHHPSPGQAYTHLDVNLNQDLLQHRLFNHEHVH